MNLEFAFNLHFFHEKQVLVRVHKRFVGVFLSIHTHEKEKVVHLEHSEHHDVIQTFPLHSESAAVTLLVTTR